MLKFELVVFCSTMRKIPALLLLLFSLCRLTAQEPAELIRMLNDSFPQERIHIHFDRDVYTTGDKIWFKAYLFSGFLPSSLSSNFIAELVSPEGKLVERQRLPIMAGTASGSFDLPDSLPGGQYSIRAYTPWMLNFNENFLYRKSLFVYKPGTDLASSKNASGSSAYKVYVFPEGGDLVYGFPNSVAVKCLNPGGQPAEGKGRLIDGDGVEVVTFNTVHDGMGKFAFFPEKGKSYQLEMTFGNAGKTLISLPAIKEKGWILQAIEESENRRQVLIASTDIDTGTVVTLLGQMQQQVLIDQKLKMSTNSKVLRIDTKDLPSGILQLTLFDQSGKPVAERLLFINNREYLLPVTLHTDTLSFQKKARNVYSFKLSDSISANLSVSIVDVEKTGTDSSRDEIISRLLLTADIKGEVNDPAYYLSGNDRSIRSNTDLLMMTQGWRRFNWQEVQAGSLPAIKFRDKNYIQLSGTVYNSRTQKKLNSGEINFFIKTKDSVTDLFQTEVAKDGRFLLENLVFYDTAQFSFQLNSNKNKEKLVKLTLDRDTSFHELYASARFDRLPSLSVPWTATSIQLNQLFRLNNDTSGNYRMLESITVIGKRKRPLQELNERYTSGLFTSMNFVKIIDLVHDPLPSGALNVFQYIQGRIPGVRVQTSGFPPSYVVYSGRAMSLTGGPIPVPLFLDEVAATSKQIETIPMQDVAMIKFFQTGFMGNPSLGSTQALAVYTRRPGDRLPSNLDFLDTLYYPGYSVKREFYSPDYDEMPARRSWVDRRVTLLWEPDLKPDDENGNYHIRFYNSDFARKLLVRMEGTTADGKLISFVKWIE